MTYAKWLERMQREKEERAERVAASQGHLPAHLLASAAVAEPEADVEHYTLAGLPEEDEDASEAGLDVEAAAGEPEPCEPEETRAVAKVNPAFLPAVEYFQAGKRFSVGEIDIDPFTIPHDAADPAVSCFMPGRSPS